MSRFIVVGCVAELSAQTVCPPRDLACLEAAVVARPDDYEVRRELGVALADVAVWGTRGIAERAQEILRGVLAVRPEDARARVHLGWVIILAARDAPLARMRALADEGFREMDAAVAAAPADPGVRFVRARNDYQMPLIAGREALAAADFSQLIAVARRGAADEALPVALCREILFHGGAFALKQGRSEALTLLEAAAALAGDVPSDDVMQSMLALARRALTPPSDAQSPEKDQAAAPRS